MNLRKKKIIFVAGTLLAMTVLFTLVSITSFRYFTLDTVRAQSHMAAEMVRVALTEEMAKGLIKERADLITRMHRIPGLKNIHVVRGEPVIRQFGPGSPDEQPRFAEEKEVLRTGKSQEAFADGWGDVYRVTIPYIASRYSDINCMQCHEVAEGTVNGAVTLTFDLAHQRHAAFLAIVPIILLLLIFSGALAYYLTRLLNPIVRTATDMEDAMGRAEKGDFSGRLAKGGDDEIGAIAERTNTLMQRLQHTFGAIVREVETLTGREEERTDRNLLDHTVHVVRNMVAAVRFRQTIETDHDLAEVYGRIQRMLKEEFGLSRFSFYELDAGKNRLRLVFAEGLPEGAELWCDPEILVQSETCRARRTAREVASVSEPGVCPAFSGNRLQDKEDLVHICLPVMQAGGVGGVLQMILPRKQQKRMQAKLTAIHGYLEEVAPVIEAKRLMQDLRESSLRDAMTGLRNRRFLEEYVETLTATVARRQATLGVLMVDLDFFKQVNDSLGHEIGDMALKGTAELMRQALRASDMLIRYGGEEFLALLPGAGEEKAMEVAERIRAAMEAHTFQTTSGPLKKTLSVGVALYPGDGEAFWECVKYADVALYAAKEAGRNRVLRFTRDMCPEEEHC